MFLVFFVCSWEASKEKYKGEGNHDYYEGGFGLMLNKKTTLNASVSADWIKLTFCVWYSFGSEPPLDQHTYRTHNKPDSSYRPVKPAEWTWGHLAKHIVHLIWQRERPHQVIHTQHHGGGSKHRCVDYGEQFLPQESEESSDDAGSQHHNERHPHWSKAVELSDDHQDGEGEQAPQLQPAEEEPH